jgi:SAM-dependent methyltransferase
MLKEEYIRMYDLESTYWWYKGLHELVEYFVQKKANNENNIKILDAGCGTGELLKVLSKYGQAEGFDNSNLAIDFCKKRNLKETFQIDLNEWAPLPEKYDVIICNDVLYHSLIKDDYQVLQNIFIALKQNGILILSLPAFDVLKRHHDYVVMGARRYRKRNVKMYLRSIGFKIEKSSYRLPFMFVVLIVKKMIEKIVHPSDTTSDLKPLPDWLNMILLFFTRIENVLIMNNLVFPFGSSLFVIARK